MESSSAKPWLIDGCTGATTTYNQLLAEFGPRKQYLRMFCRPRDTRDALLELTRALVVGTELTLIDAGFTSHELVELGLPEACVNVTRPVVVRGDITAVELAGMVSVPSNFKLGLFTSGSTGLPTLVQHTLTILGRSIRTSPRHREDVWALAYSPTHIAGVQVWLQALANCNSLVDLNGADPNSALDAIEQHRVTHISATPSFYRLMLGSHRVVRGVRSVALGGEISDAHLHQRIQGMFPEARLHNIYASTETGSLLEANGEVFTIPSDSSGQLRICDGQLQVHRSLLGKFDRRLATESSDWYETGDIVEVLVHEPVSFRFIGRARDWINVGGSKVNPHEVENELLTYPGISDARVYGRSNSVLGQVLCAEVVLEESASGDLKAERSEAEAESELRKWLNPRLQPFKVPRLISFVKEIDRTRTGKVKR